MNKLLPSQRLYQLPVPIVAITGNVASGKSTVMNFIQLHGRAVIELDRLIQHLYQRPTTLEQLRQWAPEVLANDHLDIHRETLRKKFFTDLAFKQQWEQYLQVQLPELARQLHLERFQQAPQLFIEIPLLFEKQLQSKVDLIVLVTTNSDRQLEWFNQRPHELELEQVRAHQIPAQDYRTHCHFIIENLGSTEDLRVQSQQLIQYVDHLFSGV